MGYLVSAEELEALVEKRHSDLGTYGPYLPLEHEARAILRAARVKASLEWCSDIDQSECYILVLRRVTVKPHRLVRASRLHETEGDKAIKRVLGVGGHFVVMPLA